MARSPATTLEIDLPVQPATEAIRRLVELTKFQILYAPSLLEGVTANAVHGDISPRVALGMLLKDTGIEMVDTGPDAATLRPIQPSRRTGGEGIFPAVVVTARKFSERLMDVPIAVSVLSGRTLAESGAAAIADALQDAPGVSVYDTGYGLTRISIRGISTSLGGNENGYYLDEIPFSGISVPLAPDVRSWDLDRVEILRGPQGTLFGEGSMGGTIRTLTTNARLDKVAFAASTGLSASEGGGTNRALKAMVNLPLINDTLAVRVAATNEFMSGWLDQPDIVRRNVNPSTLRTTRLRALFQPQDRLSINASYWTYKGSYQPGVYATDAGLAPVKGQMLYSSPQYTLKGLSGTYDFDTFSAFYGYSSNTYQVGQSGLFVGTPFNARADISSRAHELRLSSKARTPWHWTAGLYRNLSARNDAFFYPILDIDQRTSIVSSATSVFGEVAYTLPEFPVEVNLGMRHFLDRRQGSDIDHGVIERRAPATFRSNNPRLSLSYRPNSDSLLYSSASRGFRSGQAQVAGFAQLARAYNVTVPTVIEPDSIWTYELGTKLALLQRRLNLELALYHSDWKNVAVRLPLGDSGLNILMNSNGTKTKGFDASASYTVNEALRVSVAGGLVDATYRAGVPGTNIRKGSPVDDVPRFTLSASASYNFVVAANWRGAIRGGIQHASAHPVTTYPEYLPGDAINNINARLSFANGPWSISLFGENLGNDRGATSYRTATPLTATTTEVSSPRLRPRTLGMEVLFTFN